MPAISPEIFDKIRHIEIQSNRLAHDVLAGAYRSAFKGRGMEFEEVRAYEMGDDVRNIDWNVTARMNHPYVKNFREEREISVMLVVDVSASSRFGSLQERKNDLIAEMGAVLAFSAIRNHDKVGLILFSDEVEQYLAPKKGLRHVLRVIRELLAFEPEHHGTDMGEALAFLGKEAVPPGICFLISDFMCGEYAHEMALLAKRHDLIAIHVADPFESQMPKMALVEFEDLETGEHRLVDTSRPEVRQELDRAMANRLAKHRQLLNKVGASGIEVQTDHPYIPPLRRFFQERRRRLW